jgi:amino acid transporter
METAYKATHPGSTPPPRDEQQTSESGEPRAHLGLFDAICIIVGIVIGSTIYRSPNDVMSNVTSPGMGIFAWGLGGLLSLIGALCYAELASTYPRTGGDYVFLSRAFGDWCGFLFGWAQLAVILTSSIAMMGFVFGDYAVQVWKPPESIMPAELWTAVFAAGAVIILSVTNILGVIFGKLMQNLLSVIKVLGLGAIVYTGFQYGGTEMFKGENTPPSYGGFGLAMIFVLYAYGGWNDAAFVAAEVRKRRNIILSLILGTLLVTLIYLAVNLAYLRALGFERVKDSPTVAFDVGKMALGEDAARAIGILVMVSALGAINGLAFTGSRVYSRLGADYGMFAILGKWNPKLGSPIWALAIQAAVTVAMIAAVGTPFGRNAIDKCVTAVGLDAMPWETYRGGFPTLLNGTAPVFWAFFFLSGLSLFALRQRDPDVERPFEVPLFPLLPLIFCGTSAYMLYSAIAYAKWVSLIGALPLALGLALYAIAHKTSSHGSRFSASTQP